jgi:hypothetical protein
MSWDDLPPFKSFRADSAFPAVIRYFRPPTRPAVSTRTWVDSGDRLLSICLYLRGKVGHKMIMLEWEWPVQRAAAWEAGPFYRHNPNSPRHPPRPTPEIFLDKAPARG